MLFAAWLGALALSVYEIVDIIAVPTRGLFTLNIGVGLYLCGFAALVGSVCSLTDLAQLWSDAHPVGPANPGAVWAGGLVALAVVAAAAFFAGYRSCGRARWGRSRPYRLTSRSTTARAAPARW